MSIERARKLLCLALVSLPLCGHGQSSKESTNDLARQLVQLLRYDRQMEAYREQCTNTAKTVSPESLVKENPQKYGGVTPGDRHWPQVVQAYEQYFRDLCEKPTLAEFVDAMAKVYAREMSVPDLRRAIEFYSTDAGRRLTESHRNASTAISHLVSEASKVQVPNAMTNFDRRIEEIASLAEAAKKCPPAKDMRANRAVEGGRAPCEPRAAPRER